MLPDLNEIKPLRKELSLTQKELSVLSEISQAMIAKIESGKVIPGYNKAKSIFDALHGLKQKKYLTAIDIANKKIEFINFNANLRKAVLLMQKKSISQLPVLKKGKVIGIITEKTILDEFENEKEIKNLKVNDFIQESFVITHEKTNLETISRILSTEIQAVLIEKNGRITGIITRSDLLKTVLKTSQKN